MVTIDDQLIRFEPINHVVRKQYQCSVYIPIIWLSQTHKGRISQNRLHIDILQAMQPFVHCTYPECMGQANNVKTANSYMAKNGGNNQAQLIATSSYFNPAGYTESCRINSNLAPFPNEADGDTLGGPAHRNTEIASVVQSQYRLVGGAT